MKKKKNQVENKSKKKNTSTKKPSGIINFNFYTNKVRSLDGKKPDKRTCVYYDKNSKNCTNKNCSKIICYTASNCTAYKRKEKEIRRKLSHYNENYLPLPYKAGTHERTNEYIGVSKNIGTSMHVGYLKSNEPRRHKSRCIFYEKESKNCTWYFVKCSGSNKCEKYSENNDSN